MPDKIIIKGAREHNLKNVSLEIPRDKMVVFTGLSGSGKSSLALDTIFAEGQRRYVESLSAYARQFLGKMDKPDVDEIEGLSPAISIDQKSHSHNPRSTVATITEMYDYLRVLFARAGKPVCPKCGTEIKKMTNAEMVDMILDISEEEKTKKSFEEILILAPAVRGRKGEYYQMLYDFLNAGFREARIDGKIHSLKERVNLARYKPHTIELIIDRIPRNFNLSTKENRLRVSEAIENALKYGHDVVTIITDHETTFSAKFLCPNDGFSFPEIEPRLFSFNSPYGACLTCNGLGTEDVWSEKICPDCLGKRLREEALCVLIDKKHIATIAAMTVFEASNFFKKLGEKASEKQDIIRAPLREVSNRLRFLEDVGLEYLTLDRKAGTLSGGEAQRIRLASQIGSRLVGTLYILDEPTIGLHQRDNEKLIHTLQDLRDLGNTLIVVEHDEDTIRAADYLVDFGPGAGVHGGEIVASGELKELLKQKSSRSLTLDYLRGKKFIPVPTIRRGVRTNHDFLEIQGASAHNLKNITAKIPLRRLVVVTGVSGSGKSTLIYDILYKTLANRFYAAKYRPGNHTALRGLEYIDRVVNVDQSAIGRSSRSNPATYTGVWTEIRELFTLTEEARIRGYKPSRFSFNVKGGRCENCCGHGVIAIEMHFLPTVYVSCEVCRGKRFDRETLEVEFRGKNVFDILKMTVEEAFEIFKDLPRIRQSLQILKDVGLGYVELGQTATTLSGGEAQRIKLSAELGKPDTHRSLYLLDEPTTGLHFADIEKLLIVLQRLVDRGNTVIVIEHNLDVIKCADWVMDLGPEGGEKGGQLVAEGTPEDIARKKTFTAEYLKRVL